MREWGDRILVVGADVERLGRLAGAIVREGGGGSFEFRTASEVTVDRVASTAIDCLVCEVPPAGPPGGLLSSLREEPPVVPVVLFGEDESSFESTGIEVADTVVVGPDAEGVEGLLVSVESVVEDAPRPERFEGDADREHAEYERVVETAPIGLTTLGPEGRITWANEVYAETLDVPREELLGTAFLDFVEAGYYDETVVDHYFENVRRLLSSSTDADRTNYEVRTHLPGGETLIHDVHMALLPLDDGEFNGTVHAFRDVTTQRSYERELERQNERLDEFASVVSHDLRNPLAVAEAYLDVAAETGDRAALETVADAHGRMDALVDDLLRLARNGCAVEDPTPTDVAVVASRAWSAVETGGAALAVEDPGTVLADAARLRQAFENLFCNAVEHGSTSNRAGPDDAVEHGRASDRADSDDPFGRGAPDGRAVDEAETDADITVTVGPLDDPPGFFVADDGGGIPDGERERVFEHGYTTAADGTGFGLAIVETIVEAHDWSVTVTESEDGGARFEVRGVERVA